MKKGLLICSIIFITKLLYGQEITSSKYEYLGQILPKDTPIVFAPGIISTKDMELNSVFAPDLKSFYFTRFSDNTNQTIYCANKINDSVWSKPVIVSFSGTYKDADMCFTEDSKTLCFSSMRPVNNIKPDNFDIWRVSLNNGKWSEPEIFEAINSNNNDFYPTIDNYNNIYFSSSRAGGIGGSDIYRLEVKNNISNIVLLDSIINSKDSEFDPFISKQDDFLIFSSNREGGFGSSDLYISFKTNFNNWTSPINMGSNINSSSWDYSPMITPDGKYLFFTSGRNGDDDIFWVSVNIINKLREKNNDKK